MASHGVAQLGFWAFFLAMVAQATYDYGAGPLQTGILFSCFSVVFIVLTPLFGMLVDRWSPKGTILLGQAAAVGSVLPALLGSTMESLYLASLLDGVAAAAIIPARGSLTALLVPRRDLVRANGTMNTAGMLAVIVGPGLTGVLGKDHGAGAMYLVVLVGVVLAALLLLVVPDARPRGEARGTFLSDLGEGFRLAWRHRELRSLLVLGGAGWFIITVLITLEPIFVREVLRRDEDGLGLLWSAHGLGAFLGAVGVTRLRRGSGREVLLLGLALLVGAGGLVLYTGTAIFAVAAVGNAVFGATFAWFLSLSQALIQRVTAEDMRGRVTGVVGMLQESSALVSSVGVAVVSGAIVAVQPFLLGAAAILAAVGLYGVRAGRPSRRREPGAVEADAAA